MAAERTPDLAETGRGDFDSLALARALLALSVLRQKLFDGFLRQASWDMLLSLYVARHERDQLSAKAVCALSGEPFPVASRRLRELERHGLVARRGGGRDPGDDLVEITGEAAASIEHFFRDLAAGVHLRDGGAGRGGTAGSKPFAPN